MRVAVGVMGMALALQPLASARAEVEWSPVTGRFTARYMGYDEESPHEDRKHFGEGELRIEIAGRLTEKLELVAVPLLQYDTSDKTADEFRLYEDEIQRPLGTFEELRLTYYGEKFELSIGKAIFAWGVSRGLKPLDNMNAADFLDVPTLHKTGVPAVSFLHYGKVEVQVVVAPLFTPHRLPQPDNRWTILPEEALRQIEEATGVEPAILIHRNLPEHDLDNAQVGLRLRSSSLVSGWDLEVSAYHGQDPFGLFSARLAFAPVRVLVEAIYPEFTETGAGFSTSVRAFTFHGEAVYHRTSHDIDDDYFQYVGGVDYVLDHGIPTSLDRILFGLEYIGESIDNHNTRPVTTFSTGFNRALVNSALGLVDFVFSEETKLRVGGGINFNDDDITGRVELDHELVENLALQVGVEGFSGPSDSFYGNWQENDRVFVFTVYHF
jgi:hypothetical protein